MCRENNIFINLLVGILFLTISSQLAADNDSNFKPTDEQLNQLRDAVADNDIAAIHMLGMLYMSGQGVEKNVQIGTELIQRSADRGFANSQLLISMMYNTGRGMYEKDRVQSLAWAMMAKAQGLKEAEDYYQYVSSESSPDELRKAVELYKKLAAR